MDSITDKIFIRSPNFSDIEAMSNLLEQLFSIEADFNFDPVRHRKGFELLLGEKSTAHILAAEYAGRIVGMCTMQILVSTAQGTYVGLIEDMIVDRDFRSQGIGTMLLSAMQNIAKEKGLTRLQLLADKDNNSAIKFYEKMNWQTTNLVCIRRMI